jgi:hypothetical protein
MDEMDEIHEWMKALAVEAKKIKVQLTVVLRREEDKNERERAVMERISSLFHYPLHSGRLQYSFNDGI